MSETRHPDPPRRCSEDSMLPEIEVIIPVRGAADPLERCLQSLGTAGSSRDYRVTLVIDGPQSEAVEACLSRWSRVKGSITHLRALRRPVRGGFAKAVNHGLARRAEASQVVLLNSDTEVSPGWLDRLLECATSRRNIGTVTPLTNNGTIASVPEWLHDNLLPAGFTTSTFSQLVRDVSQHIYPEVPTGVGFCMLITGQALDVLDRLDTAYGLGYGEEVDYCLQLSRRGLCHLIDDSTFVYHQGGASFGDEQTRLRRSAGLRLRLRHPGFRPALGKFVTADPLRPVRKRILEALRSQRNKPTSRRATAKVNRARRYLHIVHGWPPHATGGTEHYARALTKHQAQHHRVTVLARAEPQERPTGAVRRLFDEGISVVLFANHFDQRSPLSRNALVERRSDKIFRQLIASERPDLIHIHHLAGHSLKLLKTAARASIPVIVQLQDWWFACRRANLWHRDQRLCSGPKPVRCAKCLPYTKIPPAMTWSALAERLRRRWVRRWLPRADALICGSEQIAESLSHMLELDLAPEVLPYGLLQPQSRLAQLNTSKTEPRTGRPLRLGVIATAMPHKGIHLAIEAVSGFSPKQVRLSIWGAPANDLEYRERLQTLSVGAPVECHGPFDEAEKFDLIRQLDALVVPSVGLESFGIVVREAHATGTPVLVAAGSALSESLPPGSALSFEPSTEALRDLIQDLLDDHEILARERSLLQSPKPLEVHATEIEAVYDRVLHGTGA